MVNSFKAPKKDLILKLLMIMIILIAVKIIIISNNKETLTYFFQLIKNFTDMKKSKENWIENSTK